MRIGAQLFTVRDACRTPEGIAESLAKVADMGYTTVQISSIWPFEPDWMAEQLKKNGLTCNLTHVWESYIVDETDKCLADHKTYGCKYIGIGSMPEVYRELPDKAEGARLFAEKFLPAARKFRDNGAYFMYHNHNFEYAKCPDGRTQLDALAEVFAPDEMGFILDTYWVKFAGYDPISEIEKLHGRLPAVHYKDMEVLDNGERRFTWVGNGILNFEKITAALEKAGTEYIFVEQDECFGMDPFDCLRNSYQYLSSIGLK